jgi:hypothetical protein
MNTPSRRNEDGDSTKARGCSPRKSVTNHHGHASRSGNRTQAGTAHPSRRALGTPAHIRAAAETPAWRSTLP